MGRRIRSDWDISGNSPLRTTSAGTEPRTLETHYAESEIQNLHPSNHLFFGSLRHNSHYFPIEELPNAPTRAIHRPTRFNYLKYAKASEISRNRLQDGPHLSLKHLSFALDLRSKLDKFCLRSSKLLPTLHDITLDLRGGEAMAIMYTNEHEVRTLLKLFTSKHQEKGRFRGEISLNGHPFTLKQLARRSAHVSLDEPTFELTVKQYLKFTSSLKKPATSAFKVDNMIDQLIQTLALSPYKNELIRGLTEAERQRVKVAAAVLKDTDILFVDNITKELEIYDVAFIVDYLRDWATKLNRIVLMAISPPSIEILTMFQKASILASGRFLYADSSNRLIPYFERHNFPCPTLKNPCDYYVDLVTHDHLSAESSKESTARIRFLSDLWKRERAESMQTTVKNVSPPMNDANFLQTMLILYKRNHWIFLNSPFLYLREPLSALFISTIFGLIFYDLKSDKRGGIEDRFGFVGSMLCFMTLFIGWINISTVHKERDFTSEDLHNRLFSAQINVFIKFLFDIPLAMVTGFSSSFPALLLSGTLDPLILLDLESTLHQLILPILLTVHLEFWRLLAWNLAYLMEKRLPASILFGFLLLASVLSSGLLIRSEDQGKLFKTLRSFTPTFLIANPFLEILFFQNSQLHIWFGKNMQGNLSKELIFDCDKHNILAAKIKEIPIYTVSNCARIRGTHALYSAGFIPFSVQDVSTLQLETKNIESSLFSHDPNKPSNIELSFVIACFLFLFQFLCLLFTSSLKHHARPKKLFKSR
ncbi:unnamed protein product, partial [Mesorhabditis belari]|uniref:ABC transporter domain-containing protein n=1 Tax=Mesorhabditis belari TaxID=2138241 RepID=A0AAF3F559_9BILA